MELWQALFEEAPSGQHVPSQKGEPLRQAATGSERAVCGLGSASLFYKHAPEMYSHCCSLAEAVMM